MNQKHKNKKIVNKIVLKRKRPPTRPAGKNCTFPDMVYFIYILHLKFPIQIKLVPCIKAYLFINNAPIKLNLLSFFPSMFSAIARFFNFNIPCAIKMLDLSNILNRIRTGSPADSN